MPTFAILTFGCKVNQYDSQAVREALAARGAVEVAPSAPADLYVVNTCCVTAESHRKCLQQVRRLVRRHPQALVVVTGCSVDFDAEALHSLPRVHAAGNAAKPRLADDALRLLDGQDARATAPCAAPAWPSITRFAGHTRAFVKVEDGCDAFCSYCIVPHVRGRVRSRPQGEVVAEVERLVEGGTLEVVLTGIHLGAYGQDAGRPGALVPLLERLVRVPGLRRLRLSSLELGEVSDALVDLLAACPILCPHLHIPLQSGDDAVLRAMNRHYTAAAFLDRLAAVRERLPEAAVTTDLIVGFPGETEEQFRRTAEVARRAAFARVHVFPYSDRPGTAAAELPGKLSREAVRARRERLLGVARELAVAWHRRFVGRAVQPLVETRRDRRTSLLCGYTERYVRVFLPGSDALMGRIVPVAAARATARGVVGAPAEVPPDRPG